MSVPLSQRWTSDHFVREVDGYKLKAWNLRPDELAVVQWKWECWHAGDRQAYGFTPSEKTAKLAATRAMERHRGGRK